MSINYFINPVSKGPVRSFLLFIFFCCLVDGAFAQTDSTEENHQHKSDSGRVYYGMASYYGDKFNGRKTATGEIFDQEKYTAACNVLPLGTWIKVTNLKNGKTVVVRTNDRLHPKMKRIVDLSSIAAKKLNYINSGVTRVKVELVDKPGRKKKKKESTE